MEDAEYLRTGGRYNSACFMAQQSAEKTLKAYLYWCGEEIVLGHSTAELAKRCLKQDMNLDKHLKKIPLLDKYYIPTRFPNGLADGGIPFMAYDEDDADKAIKIAQDLQNAIADKMKDA